jgi:hypothetical protein
MEINRESILMAAKNAVCTDRNKQYGSPEDNFALIAKLWGNYAGSHFDAIDVAVMMILLKVARISTGGTYNLDNWIDIAGYAACGGEVQCGD